MTQQESPKQPHSNHHKESAVSRENFASPSPTPSTVSSNGSSVTSSAISLSMNKINHKNSTNPTIASLHHDHQQLHQRHQHNLFSRFQQQNYDDDHQHHQQCLEDLQTHHQMTANLFMARTIALSTSRDLDLLHQSTTSSTSTTTPTNSTTASISGNFLLPCPLCETPLEPRLFRQHLDRHYPRDSPVCPVLQCGRRFAHPNSVRNHMRIKHTIQWTKMKAMRSSGGPFTGMPDYK
ncbi:unnamed protein product [Hermetia illucens]|uniref:C2H2-type domain-containing protein n=2 Tax=Hermetia illucens TaxID=343691 RepID=A0A7R8YQ40_HERIL|nr:unnamed protein product [Hermetia illucens]